MSAGQRLELRRLRAPDRRGDALAARLRTERALAAVELRPRALPPAAILVVRSLRSRVGDAPAALDALLRVAARPAHGPVPAGAPAVLFASRAELLACLAADWCSGRAHAHWWWTLVAAARPDAPYALWEAAPEHVPAAFAILASSGRAVEFASRIPDEPATRLTLAVAHVHGVAPPGAPAPVLEKPAAVEPPRGTTGEVAPVDVTEARASELTAPQRELLRLALTLYRAPATLRAHDRPAAHAPVQRRATSRARAQPRPADVEALGGPTGAEEHAREIEARGRGDAAAAAREAPPPPAPAAPLAEQRTQVRPPPRPVRPAAARSGRKKEEKTGPPAVPGVEPPSPPAAAGPPALQPRGAPPGPAARPHAQAPAPHEVTAPESPRVEPGAATPAAAALGPAERREPRRHPERDWARPVETDVGGVLFLLGVAQRLGLYADFTQPAAPGLALDPWRFAALAGRTFVDLDLYGDDAVWLLLDDLARSDAEDAELDEHIAAVRRWLSDNIDLPLAEVLVRRALVYADDVQVDVVFSLVEHPIELRLSGIDIDPGWIPAAGRALYFHFE